MNVGDTLEMKKPHPCGCSRFTLLRVGADLRIKCLSCGRDMILSREKVEKAVKSVIPAEKE